MESKRERLHIDMPPKSKVLTKNAEDVSDSWEDDASSPVESDVQTPTEATESLPTSEKSKGPTPGPPPPTPISPETSTGYVDWSPATALGGGRPQSYASSTPSAVADQERRRPEKTTATASRMIAASLGVKAPKKTEEQRQYERSIKEQEIKRRNKEKEVQERQRLEDEKAKNAMWGS